MSIKSQLVLLITALALGVAALSGGLWLDAQARLQALTQAQHGEAVSYNAALVVAEWALDRSSLNAALSHVPLLVELADEERVERRRLADLRSNRALVSAEGVSAPGAAAALREAEQARAKLIALRGEAEAGFYPRTQDETSAMAAWAGAVGEAIDSFQRLRDLVERGSPMLDPRVVDAGGIRQGVYLISVFGARERDLLTNAIAQRRKLTDAEISVLAEIDGHLAGGWSMLRARRHLHDFRTRRAIDTAEQYFVHGYQDLRATVRAAALTGDYALSAADWSRRATATISAVQAVQAALHEEIELLLEDRAQRADLDGWTSVLALGCGILAYLAALWVILVGVSRQLADQRVQIQSLEKQERMSSLGALVAGVAHEINTPIGVAVTAASYLADFTGKLGKDYQADVMTRSALEEYLESSAEGANMILKNLERAASLIASFKRVSVDQTSDERRSFNLAQLVEDVLATLRPQLRPSQHRIAASIPPDLTMDGYPGLIAQIITNLIMNSLVHAFPSGRVGAIEIAAICRGDKVRLIYRDDGVGAPEDVIKRMFEPFFTTKRGAGGSGLGLSIVHTLVVQKLGGAIDAFGSDPGLRFDITLPCRVAPAVSEAPLSRPSITGLGAIFGLVRRSGAPAAPSLTKTP